MALQKRSPLQAVSGAINGVSSFIESTGEAAASVAARLPTGVDAVADLAGLYLDRWVESVETQLIEERIERNVRIQNLKAQAQQAGLNWDDLIKPQRLIK